MTGVTEGHPAKEDEEKPGPKQLWLSMAAWRMEGDAFKLVAREEKAHKKDQPYCAMWAVHDPASGLLITAGGRDRTLRAWRLSESGFELVLDLEIPADPDGIRDTGTGTCARSARLSDSQGSLSHRTLGVRVILHVLY